MARDNDAGDIAVDQLSYTEASHELDEIVAFFEKREVDVDLLVARLERATAIVDELDRRLRRTRTQVEELVPRLERAVDSSDDREEADEDLDDDGAVDNGNDDESPGLF